MKGDGICECIGAAGRNQHPDYSRGSLLEVEALYFRSIKELLLADWNLPIDEFEKMLSVYVIDCAIRHHDDASAGSNPPKAALLCCGSKELPLPAGCRVNNQEKY